MTSTTPEFLRLPPTGVKTNLERALQAGLVGYVGGSPGIGKSDIVRSVAHDWKLALIDIRLPQYDITDFNGLPFRNPQTGKAEFIPFDTFPTIGDNVPKGKDGWMIFIDELPSAGKQLQAAAYKLLLDKMVGNHDLHPNVALVGAGNLKSDNAVAFDMSTALQSRMIHFEMMLHHGDWMNWATKKGIDSRILAFLSWKPELLHKFDPNHTDKTFACPRTWEFASRLIVDTDVTQSDLPLLAGTVAPGPAMEFIEFVRIYSQLPALADIIANPHTAPLPTEPGIKFALSTFVADKIEQGNVQPLIHYLRRLPVECQVLALRMIRAQKPQLVNARCQPIVDLLQELVDLM